VVSALRGFDGKMDSGQIQEMLGETGADNFTISTALTDLTESGAITAEYLNEEEVAAIEESNPQALLNRATNLSEGENSGQPFATLSMTSEQKQELASRELEAQKAADAQIEADKEFVEAFTDAADPDDLVLQGGWLESRAEDVAGAGVRTGTDGREDRVHTEG